MGRVAVFCAGGGGGHFWIAGRLFDRPTGPSPRADLEHFDLCRISAFAGGFSTNEYQFLVLRTFKFIGVCVEFVAAVAWLAELFPEPKQRERVLGYTQAFSSFGGILVAFANSLAHEMGR